MSWINKRCARCDEVCGTWAYGYDGKAFCSRRCLGRYMRSAHVTGKDAYEEDSENGIVWRGESFETEEELEEYMLDELDDDVFEFSTADDAPRFDDDDY